MKRRWLWLLAIALLLIAMLWQVTRPRVVLLPVANQTDDAVALEFHGDGLTQSATVAVGSHSSGSISLTTQRNGALRVRIATPALRNDAVLLSDVQSLRATPQRFEIRAGGAFVLVPDINSAQ